MVKLCVGVKVIKMIIERPEPKFINVAHWYSSREKRNEMRKITSVSNHFSLIKETAENQQ